MIATITERRYSLDEYRAIADTSEEKCEYHLIVTKSIFVMY